MVYAKFIEIFCAGHSLMQLAQNIFDKELYRMRHILLADILK